jgi:hypothetical protein
MELDITPIPSAAISSYSKEEWEQKRPIITQLYRDEEKSLDHVRSVLAQREHSCTLSLVSLYRPPWSMFIR